ncbi:hypothetical protein PISMIDRAFT_16260 [Pisolithus microcarpus 441]|uniref:Uncharacterized protein n=1 Tax=Pisolithus microcarpus 441 TaxID=765257 RepID=A0A0C9XTY8_9AGAM|nr:hypothetical protein BKA83DRAFT_16260 [Pisolithus microcarpus]KIK15835.1 hypothetical protein PISMIDRAFT_16260 [Pisolithus microcarpus 441]
MDDDVAGLKSEVARSDKPPTNAEANAEQDKNIGVDCVVEAVIIVRLRPFSVTFEEMRRIGNALTLLTSFVLDVSYRSPSQHIWSAQATSPHPHNK